VKTFFLPAALTAHSIVVGGNGASLSSRAITSSRPLTGAGGMIIPRRVSLPNQLAAAQSAPTLWQRTGRVQAFCSLHQDQLG